MAMNSANDAVSPGPQIRMPKTGEVVAERLRHQIARGELAIGQRLPPEDELTALFGIARTTLREALRILESQGLLEIRRGRTGGPVVTRPKIDSLAESLAVTLQLQGTTAGDLDVARQLIEPRLAARLAEAHTLDDLAALRGAVARTADAADGFDRVAFAAAAAGMHETLIERAGNTTLATFSRLLHAIVAQYYVVSAARTDQERMHRAVRSYRKLVRLIAAGDAAAAEEHWRTQMTFTIEGWKRHERLDLFDTSRIDG
jgi:GntR family transcriptional regulator, transcriptional repressor for pyruvate dehydrogenase complex